MTAKIEPTEEMKYQAEIIAMTVRNALEAFHGGGTANLISDEAMAAINRTVRNGAVTALHALSGGHPRAVDWVAFQEMVKPSYWETPELLPEYVEHLQANGGVSRYADPIERATCKNCGKPIFRPASSSDRDAWKHDTEGREKGCYYASWTHETLYDTSLSKTSKARPIKP